MILQVYWSIILIFFTLFLIYCNITISLVLKPQNVLATKNSEKTVKKIVAYSLRKQIELDSQEYFCDQSFFKNATLGKLSWDKKIWKQVKDAEVYFLSVTLDRRLEPFYYLRIIGVIKGSWNDTLYCQILTNDGHIHVIKSTVMPIWYDKWDQNDNNTYYNPMLISCRLPVNQDIMLLNAFTISKKPCHTSNEFYKISKQDHKIPVNFTICVKPLNYEEDNISIHLVQWIEICKILGAEYFHIFMGNVTRNTRRILEWYNKQFPNMIHLEEFRPVSSTYYPKESILQKTWQRRRYEITTYNSCFYKNMNSKYVIPLDIDELIIPKTVKTWRDIVHNLDNYSSLIVQNVYFFTQGKHLNNPFFLRENKRTKAVSKKGENGKSFISTKNALTVFNHYALHLLKPGVFKEYFLPFSDVQLNHYKEFCNPVIFPECSKYLSSPRVVDNVMFKYRHKFNERYRDVLNKLRKYGIKL